MSGNWIYNPEMTLRWFWYNQELKKARLPNQTNRTIKMMCVTPRQSNQHSNTCLTADVGDIGGYRKASILRWYCGCCAMCHNPCNSLHSVMIFRSDVLDQQLGTAILFFAITIRTMRFHTAKITLLLSWISDLCCFPEIDIVFRKAYLN